MRFGSKYVWNALFFVIGVITLWNLASLATVLIMYFRFSSQTEGRATDWSVALVSEEKYRISTDFTYSVDGKTYSAKYLFVKPIYPTKEIAEDALQGVKKDFIKVFYWKSQNGPIALLEHSLPYKEGVRFIVSFAIFLYFSFLKNYLSRFKEEKRISQGT